MAFSSQAAGFVMQLRLNSGRCVIMDFIEFDAGYALKVGMTRRTSLPLLAMLCDCDTRNDCQLHRGAATLRMQGPKERKVAGLPGVITLIRTSTSQ